MVRVTSVCVVVVLLTVLLTSVAAAPWLNFFLPSNNRNRNNYPRQRTGRNRYREICRTVNVDNYAFPGRIPYPSAPLCPY